MCAKIPWPGVAFYSVCLCVARRMNLFRAFRTAGEKNAFVTILCDNHETHICNPKPEEDEVSEP